MTMVLPPDIELWICSFLRARLKPSLPTIIVSNREPDDYDGSRPLVVAVRYGARAAPKPCRDLASRIYGLLTDPDICSIDGSPIAAIEEDGCNGPYFVAEDANVARCYLIVDFSAIGEFH